MDVSDTQRCVPACEVLSGVPSVRRNTKKRSPPSTSHETEQTLDNEPYFPSFVVDTGLEHKPWLDVRGLLDTPNQPTRVAHGWTLF